MRALIWTSLVITIGIGFVSLLAAAETGKKAPADAAKSDAAAATQNTATADAATAAEKAATADTDTSVDTDTATSSDTETSSETEIDTDAETNIDSETDVDGGVPEAQEAPPKPAPQPVPEITVEAPEIPEEPPPRLPYSKGDMEVSVGLSLAGDGNVNYLGFTAKYDYFVMDRLAPGLDLRYTGVLGEGNTDYGYADSITLLPLLKFVLARKQVAPYIFATGGYEWQWGSNSAANAWILGLGGGVNVSVSKHILINIELTALHYWYTKKKIYWYNDKDPDLLRMKGSSTTKLNKSDCAGDDCQLYDENKEYKESDVTWVNTEGDEYVCTNAETCGTDKSFKDKTDKDHEWFFPLISVGLVVTF